MELRKIVMASSIAAFAVSLGLLTTIADEQYMLISIVLLLAAMAPFFIRFERRALHAREVVLIAALAAIAAVSRVPFAPLPSVQPTTFVIIAAAIVFGKESGFLIGAFAALVSNMMLGQGPWTPWQMFSWGMVGYTAGWLGVRGLLNRKAILLAFGFIWGFLFGWIMNLWSILGSLSLNDWAGITLRYAQSFPFDLAHALSNVLFLALFAPSWLKIMRRFKRKYGLLEERAG